MELINQYEISLGLEHYEILGFETEDQLKREITELMKLRTDFIEDN